MSENITVSRPYAKAIFSIAKNTKTLSEWNKLLFILYKITENSKFILFVKNSTISYNDKSCFIMNLLDFKKNFDKKLEKSCKNFLYILSYYNRLLCLKNIFILYKSYIDNESNSVKGIVKLAYAINNFQKNNIVKYLSKIFNRNVSVVFEINSNLIGGFSAKVGDFVLDASISGNLKSLYNKITF